MGVPLARESSNNWRYQAISLKTLLAEDFADNSFNLFSSPSAFQAFSQFRFVVIFGELPKQSSGFFTWSFV